MRSPSPPAVDYFGKLPVELLDRIVGMVKLQDEAFKQSTIKIADDTNCKEHMGEGTVDILNGVWSSQYGRGVAMLSRVDKRCRRLSFPKLCEVSTSPSHRSKPDDY